VRFLIGVAVMDDQVGRAGRAVRDKEGKVTHVDPHKVAMEINGYYLEDLYDKIVAVQ
jgi:hypothetical protein